eukprot:scaffold7396_cov127-Skeletonema_menzelii.AAC.7
MHTLVSFLKKRIPCSCLDEKYKEVKSIPKIGLCCNHGCSLPFGKTERSLTECCSRCRTANYCSRKCQVAAWPGHKVECTFYADLKAKYVILETKRIILDSFIVINHTNTFLCHSHNKNRGLLLHSKCRSRAIVVSWKGTRWSLPAVEVR